MAAGPLDLVVTPTATVATDRDDRRRPGLDPALLTAATRAAIPLLADLGLGPNDD